MLLLCYRYNLQNENQICRMHPVLYCNEVTEMRYIYLSNLAVKHAVKQGCQLMLGCGPQFMDHMHSVSRGWLQILSPSSEVDRLKESSKNKYALLVCKKIQCVTHGPSLATGPCIARSAGSVITQLCQNTNDMVDRYLVHYANTFTELFSDAKLKLSCLIK